MVFLNLHKSSTAAVPSSHFPYSFHQLSLTSPFLISKYDRPFNDCSAAACLTHQSCSSLQTAKKTEEAAKTGRKAERDRITTRLRKVDDKWDDTCFCPRNI